MNFKDLFSVQAKDYALYRPRYPDSLFQYLAGLTAEHQLVWDCGTGNGQAAVQLARYFSKVVATDPSEKQLQSAEPHPNVTYQVASAEKSPLADQSADLVTVAQAFHWFKHPEFFSEVQRVLKPNGIVAIWSYNLCRINSEVDSIVDHFYGPILGPYWEKERKLVEEGYRNCIFPLTELSTPAFEMKAEWDLKQLLGYLSTWSSLQTYIKKEGSNPLLPLIPQLQSAWKEEENKKKEVRWSLSLRVGTCGG